MSELVGKTVRHYTIVEEIGRGGMGIVYKARDTKLDRMVALKFLSSQESPGDDAKQRFIQEARAAAALNHPNILNVYDIDETDGSLFIAMEYLDGQTLKAHLSGLKSNTGVPLAQALEWTIQIAQGLAAAHEKNIVHRDVKPENIMLTSSGLLKIMDFGIAKLKSGSGLTRTGVSLGTLSYLSPEQAKGLPTDHRSDIWALGVVLFEMLTTDVPFKAEHEAALLYLIVNDEPPLPSMLDRRLPHQIDASVARMLSKEPSVRFQTMNDVIAALRDARHDVERSSAPSRKKAVVVLPFSNISPEKDSDYFSDGLTEEIIANLSRLKEIRVVPRTMSMQYKDTKKDIRTIGRELEVRHILAGSVRKFQQNLRISVELIDADNGDQLWAETYKGSLADVFDIQEQVSKQIVDALMVKLSPTEKVVLTKRSTLNPEAFDCHLRARNFLYRMSKKGFHFAIQLFQQAIALDPRYAEAYAGLAESYARLYQLFERKQQWLDLAMETSLKALMYNPTLAEAYSALGLAYFHKNMYDEAVTSSRKAIELDPNNYISYWILGRIYLSTDHDAEALEVFERVLQLNPEFYSVYNDLRIVYDRLGNTGKSEEILGLSLGVYARYLSQHPDDARGHIFYATDLAHVGRHDEAKVEAQKALELSPDDPLMFYNGACFYSQIGEKALAVEALRNAFAAGYADYEWAKRDTDLDPIRDEPGYVEAMRGK